MRLKEEGEGKWQVEVVMITEKKKRLRREVNYISLSEEGKVMCGDTR